jgi:predicted dehydrogenase
MNSNEKTKKIGIGIIGCGLIGNKRAAALSSDVDLIACADIHYPQSEKLAALYGAQAFSAYEDLLKLKEIDMVIIATLHDSLAEISLAAIEAGKHVFVEKPAARSARELEGVMDAANAHAVKVHVGFNHRYHRALQKAKDIVDTGGVGELMFVRARYGHGGRVGYEKEWRADPVLSGGGELIDQGPHLIDLARWFLGEFQDVQGFAHNYYWDMPVDDNGFMILKTPQQRVAFLHVSCTEWKNMFSMEIYGKLGKLDISGLGGSYGIERLTHYQMLPEMGPPDTTSWEYPTPDTSWKSEVSEFLDDIRLNREPSASLNDAYEALKIIDVIYKDSKYDYLT